MTSRDKQSASPEAPQADGEVPDRDRVEAAIRAVIEAVTPARRLGARRGSDANRGPLRGPDDVGVKRRAKRENRE